jgi:hypothetical protein
MSLSRERKSFCRVCVMTHVTHVTHVTLAPVLLALLNHVTRAASSFSRDCGVEFGCFESEPGCISRDDCRMLATYQVSALQQ